MTAGTPPENGKFDVAVEPTPRDEVVEAEEDEDSRRDRESALASTFDPALAQHGKTDEEMIEERQDETRLIIDAAIVTGIAIAVAENEIVVGENAAPDEEDDGD